MSKPGTDSARNLRYKEALRPVGNEQQQQQQQSLKPSAKYQIDYSHLTSFSPRKALQDA